KVKQELAELGLEPMDWDGDTFVVPVSAISGEGIEDVLEAILLTADEQEIVANPAGDPTGTVLEARVDRSRGVVATLLVFNGTLKLGDELVAGTAYGRIKAMFDENGVQVKNATPSMPVAVLGLHELPQPGDTFEVVKNEKAARALVEERKQEAATQRNQPSRGAVTLEDFFSQFRAGETKEMNIILKVDVQGSLQPIVDNLERISGENREGIRLRILAADVGNISESDVMLASASDAIVIG